MANRWGNSGNSDRLYFGGLQIQCRWWCSHEIKIHLLLGRKVITNLDTMLNSRHYFANKSPSIQGCDFSSSHMWMCELNNKESWAPKNGCFWTVVFRRLLRVPWTARRSNQSILKATSPEYSLERQMLKLKLQYFGHLMRRLMRWLTGKDPDAGKDWRREEKGMTEDEMVGWYHRLDGHEFE